MKMTHHRFVPLVTVAVVANTVSVDSKLTQVIECSNGTFVVICESIVTG